MASEMSLPKKKFSAIQIRNIRAENNPRLDNCSSGFDKNIVNFGFKLSRKQEGFFIIFANQATRTNYLKNSKWLKSLKRVHISPGFPTICVDLTEYSIDQGLIIPFLNLVYIHKDFNYHADFVSQEEILLAYVCSNRQEDWSMAHNLCHIWLDKMLYIKAYSCQSNQNAVCNGHIANAVLFENVAQKCLNFEKSVFLYQLAFDNINLCTSMHSRVVLIKLLLNFPVKSISEEKKRKLQASIMVKGMWCSAFETGQLSDEQGFLANHAFNMACILYEIEEDEDAENHITFIQLLTETEARKACPDKHMMRIKGANEELKRTITEKLSQPESVPEAPAASATLKTAFTSMESESPPVNDIIKIGDIIEVLSDTEMTIDVFGRGLLTVDVTAVEVYHTNDDLLVNLTGVETTKHCATVNFSQELKIKKVFIQEKDQFETESNSSEIETSIKKSKVVTFNPRDDIFGQSEEDEDSLKDEISTQIMSSATCSDIVTPGINDLENILNDLEEFILTQLEEKNQSKSGSKELHKLANTMADSWRKNQIWLEEFWDAHICNSFDNSKGRFIQPRDVNIDKIKEDLTKNYNYNPSFNKRQFLNMSAEFMSQASVKYLTEKQLEREKPKDCDDDLTKSFKIYWSENVDKLLTFDDIQEIFERNNVTLRFLKQGYECSLSDFGKYVKENLKKLEGNVDHFISVFKTFFEHEKLKKNNGYIQPFTIHAHKKSIPPFTYSPKIISELNDSIVDIENDDTEDEEASVIPDEEEFNTLTNFTEAEFNAQPYLTILLNDITNNLQNQPNLEKGTYINNIKEYLRRGEQLIVGLRGTSLMNNLNKALDNLKATLSLNDEICVEEGQMKEFLDEDNELDPRRVLMKWDMLEEQDKSTDDESEETNDDSRNRFRKTKSKSETKMGSHIKNQDLGSKYNKDIQPMKNIDGKKLSKPSKKFSFKCDSENIEAPTVLIDIYNLDAEMSKIIENNEFIDIEEYKVKVKALSVQLKKTPPGSGHHFGVNIKQLRNKIKELQVKQSQTVSSDVSCIENGIKQLDLKTDETWINYASLNNENYELRENMKQLKLENESLQLNLNRNKADNLDQTLTISCLQTENFTLKLKEKELQDTVNYIRKNQDSSLLKSLEKNVALESRNNKIETDNEKLQNKIKEMENKLQETDKEQILLEYKLKRAKEHESLSTGSNNDQDTENQEREPTEPKIKLIVPDSKKILYFKPDTANLLPMLMVKKYHPEITAIKYKLAAGNWRMLILEQEMFHPPEDGWGLREYEIVNQSKKHSPLLSKPELPNTNTMLPPHSNIRPTQNTPPGRRPIMPLLSHNPYAPPHPYSNPLFASNMPPNFYRFGNYYQ